MPRESLTSLYAEHRGKVSDKWSFYLIEYERIFAGFRDQPVRILEIGVQNGGSLEIWSRYFAQARKLVGCDINPDCAHLVYEDPRIAVVVGDANSDETQSRVLGHSPLFDIVIDDGSHRSSDIVKSFARYFPRLVDGGLFVAEDLHCSYWREFEGGLFDPFSSVAFFKRLADIVNYQHWGIEKPRIDVLKGFFDKYGVQLDADMFDHVHSVEFVNSICVIRKAPPSQNELGTRIVAGGSGTVVAADVLRSALESVPDQTGNEWTARSLPLDEELSLRIRDLAERDGRIAQLNQTISDLNQTISAVLGSTSWRITRPLRYISRQWQAIVNSCRTWFGDGKKGE